MNAKTSNAIRNFQAGSKEIKVKRVRTSKNQDFFFGNISRAYGIPTIALRISVHLE